MTVFEQQIGYGWIGVLIVAGLFLGCQSPGSSSDAVSDTETPGASASRDTLTLTGTLIDATCHAQAAPKATADCEGKYVAAGYPAGVQVGSQPDSVWILVAVPQALGEYLTSTVRVTGVVRSAGVLIPHQMDVRNGTEWAAIM